jgi:hypothetical protein
MLGNLTTRMEEVTVAAYVSNQTEGVLHKNGRKWRLCFFSGVKNGIMSNQTTSLFLVQGLF